MTQPFAPDLPATLHWLNAAAQGQSALRRGRLTLLVFVNAGSTWSLQRLHDLQALCARFPQRVRTVALHVPRFDHERDPRRVLKQLNRHGIAVPAALDADWVAWQQYGIEALPSVVVVDGAGRRLATLVGDDGLADIEALLLEAPDVADDEADAERRRDLEPRLPLRFPVGLAVTPQYLYVADSGHHRVLECNHAGRILRQFGTGSADFIDGPMDQAGFRRPHGLCLLRDALYVADTGNHAIRKILLRSGDVSTVCGNGRVGLPQPGTVTDPRAVSLDGPRALAAVQDQLYIALAGDNRVWSYDLGRAQLACRAGSGDLALQDGSGDAAAFAQPVSLAAVQQTLYVCDAAGSAIRSLQLRDHSVQTLVGQGAWTFGNDDGARAQASLQDPQAIALDPSQPLLWILDTGNDRLRSLRLGGGELASYALSQRLHGPAGLAVGADALWIADTDAHAVLRLDPDTGVVHHVPIGE